MTVSEQDNKSVSRMQQRYFVIVESSESIPGCLGEYPSSFDGNNCQKCSTDLKLQCRFLSANKPKTERKQ
jgi:hypothetical protein